MKTATYETSPTPHITVVACHDDLVVTGTGQPRVVVEIVDDSEASRIERTGETITVTAMESCEIECPTEATVTIERVSGDLRLSQLKGTLAIDTVNGDADLRDIGPTSVKAIQGDASIRDAEGVLRIETIRGDAKLKRVDGAHNIDRVSGDLSARNLAGNVNLGKVEGDLSIETELNPGQAYNANVNGDIVFRIDGGGARFNLSSRGEIRNRLPMVDWRGTAQAATGTFGDGSAQVNLSAGGDLLILPASGDWGFDDISDHVESIIESAMGQFESQMSRMQHDLEERFGKASSRSERAAERARHAAERAKRRAERAAGSWGAFFAPGRPPTPPRPPAEPVTDEERLAVLKMVEDGKITADDAAKLLAAMEGG